MRRHLFILSLFLICGYPCQLPAQNRPNSDLDLPVESPQVLQKRQQRKPPLLEEYPSHVPTELPPVFYGEPIPNETDTIVYVIDRSCSMAIEDIWWDEKGFMHGSGTGSRLEKARREVIKSLNGLSPNFRFNIVVFDCFALAWSSDLQRATPEAKRAAKEWLKAITFRGATGTSAATVVALNWRENRSVVLLTDGEPNCAMTVEQHLQAIKVANLQYAKIHVFGIHPDGIYKQFCQDVARSSGGGYFEIN